MKLQTRVQQVLCHIILALSAVSFFFALGLATDFYDLMLATGWGVDGVELFDEIQPFNRQVVAICIIMIVLSLSLFITRTHIRRRYYISNVISVLVTVIFDILASLASIQKTIKFRRRFLTEVDFEAWLEIRDLIPDFPYTESTLWLDLNVITLSLMIIISILLLGNLIWKIMLMKHEDRLLAGKIRLRNRSAREVKQCH